ncbi:MAG TPA: glycoside hydrolase family 88 protein [Nocardioidaceae bacterium]|nr:glycoside hydrolase family 88 protein [Nocardioidaceae bacterium]
MTGHDLTQAQYAAPPTEPLSADMLTIPRLTELGERISQRTWSQGLTAWFWGEGVCLLGLARLAQALGRPFPSDVRAWIDRHVDAGVKIEHINNVAPGTVAILAREGDDARYLAVAEQLYDWLRTHATRDASGALEHWPEGVWSDTTFMAGVFLAHLGAATGRGDVLDECGQQLLAHAEVLQDRETGLFVHGSHRSVTIPCFWGRGNAWCALSAVEFLEQAEATGLASPDTVDAVRTVLAKQLRALAELQPAHGVWSVLVDDHPENAGILETSAAAGIGAAMLRAQGLDLPWAGELVDAGWRAVRGALAYVDDDGMLTRVSAGTVLQLVPFGYSVIRDDRIQPWGQGLALHAVAAAIEAVRRHGIAK